MGLPGTLYERSAEGDIYNTSVLLSPDGEVAASYRKIFPWRPYEVCRPGDRFVTVDIPERGRIGLSICYDTWFPEVARHLAWLGAEVIVTPTLTPTSDRPQELVLTQATAIVNQVYTVSVNGAAPYGTGRSRIVDPEGIVRHWQQFRPADQALELPLYQGRIDPATWSPHGAHEAEPA